MRWGAVLVALTLVLFACGLEQPILNQVTEWGPDWVPDAPEPFGVRGQAYGLPGGQVDFYSAAGSHLAAYTTEIQPTGIFDSEFPGTTDYRNLVVVASSGPQKLLGLALRIPRNRDIYYDPDKYTPVYHLGGMSWGEADGVMTNLDDRTTTITLVMLRSAANLGTAGVESTNEALATLSGAIASKTGPVYAFHRMVQRILAASAQSLQYPPALLFPDTSSIYLNPDFLAAAHVDYTGDGVVDRDTAAFEAALQGASEEILLAGCSTGDRITVVFMVSGGTGNRDLNCGVINPFKHATDEEGKRMYITGGMYTTDPEAQTPVCASDAAKEPGCITPSEWAEVNGLLGNWAPNTIAMRDDGQGGDETAGDDIWTAVFEFPYIATGGQNKGVRVGYKYTFGYEGQGWTSTEEWPGNNRIFEIEDMNGDGLVVRMDYFGDETANKNVANLNNGLCGSTKNPWPEQVAPGCFSDTHENQVDADGDCVPESWPVAGAVVPNCVEPNIPGIRTLKDSEYVAAGDQPVVAAVTPGNVPNGGGTLVEVLGNHFKPRPDSDIEVNTADDATVSQNRVSGYLVPEPTRILMLAPAFPAATANIVLLGGPETAKGELQYDVTKTVPCSLVHPEEMPASGIPAGKVDHASYPVVGRMALADDPLFAPGLRVEVGMSPACCYEDEVCSYGVASCPDLPKPHWQEGWTWFPMAQDAGCSVPEASDLAACEDGETQFVGAVVPEVGQAHYRYVMRYSFDFGLSWDYCDFADDEVEWGNDDGIRLVDTGIMWVD